MEYIQTNDAPQAIGPYSQAVKVGHTLYTSGQIALTPEGEMIEGDVKDQTRQVLTNLGNVLKAGGADFHTVIKTTIFLADMDDFLAVNTIYAEFFGGHTPARSTVAVKTLPKNALVEIDAMAIVQDEYTY
jgi:2-iminobutanoate/2-iminopropanoate deaminase